MRVMAPGSFQNRAGNLRDEVHALRIWLSLEPGDTYHHPTSGTRPQTGRLLGGGVGPYAARASAPALRPL